MNETVAAPRFTPRPDPRPVDRAWRDMAWPVAPDTELLGAWLRMTPIDVEADVPELFRALDDDQVWTHLARRPANPSEMAAILNARTAETGWQPWVIRLLKPLAGHSVGTIVGMSSYLEVSIHDARLEIGSTTYRPSVWGSAVNPEAKLLLLGHAFDRLGAGRVQLKTDVRNVRSQRAIAKLGAAYEGTLRRYQRREDGTVRDSVLFSIIAEEWPGIRKRLVERIASL